MLQFYEELMQNLKDCKSHWEFSSLLMLLLEWTASPREVQVLRNFKLFDVFKRYLWQWRFSPSFQLFVCRSSVHAGYDSLD